MSSHVRMDTVSEACGTVMVTMTVVTTVMSSVVSNMALPACTDCSLCGYGILSAGQGHTAGLSGLGFCAQRWLVGISGCVVYLPGKNYPSLLVP